MIEDEKLETNRTVRKLNDSLVVLKCKLDELKVELRTLVHERDDKMNIRRLLRKDIEASSQCRASNRRDKMINWTSCRVITEEIANEESRMDKLKATLSLTRREVHRMKAQNEKVLQTKKSLVEQLAAKKALLFSLFDKNNIYAETLKKGEAICQQLEEEKKTVELKNNDIKRSITIIKADLQDHTNIEARIENAKKNLELQILETERISTALEEPNQDRFRMLDGHDPSNEELEQNLAALESLERNNREMLRTKAIALKGLAKHTYELQEELANWKASSGPYLKDINDLQGRLHELQRVRTSQLSEIQMYASLIDKLTSSKAGLEHDVSFRATLTSKPEREVPSLDVVASPKKWAMEQRPTAYMPTGPDDEIIKVPRPFGKMAPFKAIEPGSTMRHIRKPQPVPLLLPN